jgi:CheY-like chemotaxis protein
MAPRYSNPQLILVVDDDQDTRREVGALLEHWGYCTVEAATLDDALGVLARLGRCDLIVSELVLPCGGTPTLVTDLFDRHPAQPLVLTTEVPHYLAPCARYFAEIGVAPPPIVLKPLRVAELLSTVQSLIGPARVGGDGNRGSGSGGLDWTVRVA